MDFSISRISTLAGDGKGAYGYSYEFISWLLDNQSSITIPIPMSFKTVKHFIDDLHFFYNGVLKNNASFDKMDANKKAIINGEKRGCKW